MNEPVPERRLYFPAYSETFALWMRNKIICAEFLKLFANHGEPVTLTAQPQTEQTLKFGRSVRGVRFDVIAEAQDYQIYCIEAQRKFMKESYIDRTIYYGCTAIAAKALKEKEDFKDLRPVTVIFVYIDNQGSREAIDVIRLYNENDVERPYSSKMTFVNVNLNNKANYSIEDDNPISYDVRAFMDLMSIGDDEHLIELLLQSTRLSDSMRNVISLFDGLMKDVIRKTTIRQEHYTADLHQILRKDVFVMSTDQLLVQKGKVEGKIELCFTDLKLQPHEIAKKLNVPEEEVSRILKDLKLIPSQ